MKRYLIVELNADSSNRGHYAYNAFFQTDDVDQADRLAEALAEIALDRGGYDKVEVIDTTTTGWVRDVTERLRELNELEDELR